MMEQRSLDKTPEALDRSTDEGAGKTADNG